MRTADTIATTALQQRVTRAMESSVRAPARAEIEWAVEETLHQLHSALREQQYLRIPGLGTLRIARTRHGAQRTVVFEPEPRLIARLNQSSSIAGDSTAAV
jgi:nucleoid DNA-binding protein